MRSGIVLPMVLLLLSQTSFAGDQKDVDDCYYWRLGKEDAETKRRLARCDAVIAGKGYSKEQRAVAYASRADYHAYANERAKAITDLDQALALAPEHGDWRRDRAFHLHFSNLHDRAIADFDDIITASPTDAHATFFRGLSYLGKGDDARGFADMSKGIELAPTDVWYRYWRGLEYMKRGKVDEALPDLDKAIELKPDDVDSHVLRSEALVKKGRPDEALSDLTRAIESDPNVRTARLNRALLHERLGHYDEALVDYDNLLSQSPEDAYYKDRRAKLLAKGPGIAELPAAPKPTAPSVKIDSAPAGAPAKVTQKEPTTKPRPDAELDCRYYVATANMTVAVPCPN